MTSILMPKWGINDLLNLPKVASINGEEQYIKIFNQCFIRTKSIENKFLNTKENILTKRYFKIFKFCLQISACYSYEKWSHPYLDKKIFYFTRKIKITFMLQSHHHKLFSWPTSYIISPNHISHNIYLSSTVLHNNMKTWKEMIILLIM